PPISALRGLIDDDIAVWVTASRSAAPRTDPVSASSTSARSRALVVMWSYCLFLRFLLFLRGPFEHAAGQQVGRLDRGERSPVHPRIGTVDQASSLPQPGSLDGVAHASCVREPWLLH